MRGILPTNPPCSNLKLPDHPDYRRYKDRDYRDRKHRDRNRVERTFAKLKQQRRIATRYDKIPLSFGSFLNSAATRSWLKSFVSTASPNRGFRIHKGHYHFPHTIGELGVRAHEGR